MDVQGFMDAIRFFGEPKIPDGSNREIIYGSYARTLGKFNSEVLRRAAENMLDHRGHRNFPLPNECKDFCIAAQEELAEASGIPARKETRGEAPEWSERRIKAADRMMNSDIGRRAAQEGWIIHLHDFCREYERLPVGGEASTVRLQGLANKTKRDEMSRQANSKNALAMIASVARAMESRRQRLTKIAIGG